MWKTDLYNDSREGTSQEEKWVEKMRSVVNLGRAVTDKQAFEGED